MRPYRAANSGWCPVITCHFCILTYQLFLYYSVNIFLIILCNFLFCVKMKPRYYYSTEAVVWRCSVKKCVPRNSVKFTIKHLWWSLFLIKLQAACSFITKETAAQVLSCKFCENFKSNYFKELEELEGLEKYIV